jgi:hypothetical protein
MHTWKCVDERVEADRLSRPVCSYYKGWVDRGMLANRSTGQDLAYRQTGGATPPARSGTEAGIQAQPGASRLS